MTDAIRSREPMFNLPPATRGLLVACLAVFALQKFFPALTFLFSFMPARMTPEGFDILAPLTPFTYMFLHGGWEHLAINMLALVAFGSGVERVLGARRFVLLYMTGGLAGAVAEFALHPHSTMPTVGASAALSALFGALLVLAQQRGAAMRLLPIAVVWMVLTVVMGLLPGPGGAPVAWVAHLGGFIMGLALARSFQQSGNG